MPDSSSSHSSSSKGGSKSGSKAPAKRSRSTAKSKKNVSSGSSKLTDAQIMQNAIKSLNSKNGIKPAPISSVSKKGGSRSKGGSSGAGSKSKASRSTKAKGQRGGKLLRVGPAVEAQARVPAGKGTIKEAKEGQAIAREAGVTREIAKPCL